MARKLLAVLLTIFDFDLLIYFNFSIDYEVWNFETGENWVQRINDPSMDTFLGGLPALYLAPENFCRKN